MKNSGRSLAAREQPRTERPRDLPTRASAGYNTTK
jgi:hypothetical protein